MLKVGTKVLLKGEIVALDTDSAPYQIRFKGDNDGGWDSWVPEAAVVAVVAGGEIDGEPIGKTESGELVYALDD